LNIFQAAFSRGLINYIFTVTLKFIFTACRFDPRRIPKTGQRLQHRDCTLSSISEWNTEYDRMGKKHSW